ncbi:MAG: mechanosensitive ion channel family protein [Erysipelotrichales bacterium]|nr:mechanosensitive ion channel family protein [Erysipelotrichales bacterium]
MVSFATIWDTFYKFFEKNLWPLVLSISVIIIALVLIKLICTIMNKLLTKGGVDGTAISFYLAVTKLILWVVTIFIVASILSISTSSLLVGFSSIALAVALALKDSLANLANGIIIIFNKPFRRGDHIEVDGAEGKIINIKLLTSEIISADNKRIIVPNSKMVNCTITNFTSLPTRRVTLSFTVSYESDLDKVEYILNEVAKNDKRVLSKPKPKIFLANHGESSLEYSVRLWVNTGDYWDVYYDMPRKVFDAFKENNISIPFNQLDVHICDDKDGDK